MTPGKKGVNGLRMFVPSLRATCLPSSTPSGGGRSTHGLSCFLFEESTGGAICLLFHLHTPPEEWNAAVLVAPIVLTVDAPKVRSGAGAGRNGGDKVREEAGGSSDRCGSSVGVVRLRQQLHPLVWEEVGSAWDEREEEVLRHNKHARQCHLV